MSRRTVELTRRRESKHHKLRKGLPPLAYRNISSIEQLTPLTDEERQILTTKRKKAINFALIMTIVAVMLLASLIVFHTLYWLIIVPSFCLVLAISTIVSFQGVLSLSKDLGAGQKQIIRGPVEGQNIDVSRSTDSDGVEGSASYRFWIQIAGKKITVTEEQYYQFKKGDLAEAFIAPNSGTVLGINKEYFRRPFG